MERYNDEALKAQCGTEYVAPQVYRVIDDGTCVLTTLDARKALLKLMEVMDEHDVTVAWAEAEILR